MGAARFAPLVLTLAATAMACAHTSPIAPSVTAGATRKQVLVPGAGTLPYSKAVRGGDLVFVAGQLGLVRGTGDLATGGVGPETRAALEATAAILAQAGLGMDDVVKCDVFLAEKPDGHDLLQFVLTREAMPRPARVLVPTSQRIDPFLLQRCSPGRHVELLSSRGQNATFRVRLPARG